MYFYTCYLDHFIVKKIQIHYYPQSKTIKILANKLKLQLPLAVVYAYAYMCYTCANYVKLMCFTSMLNT